jgi:hypothetical protein
VGSIGPKEAPESLRKDGEQNKFSRYFLCFLIIFSSSPDELELLRDQYSHVTGKSIRLVSFVLTLPKYSSPYRSYG